MRGLEFIIRLFRVGYLFLNSFASWLGSDCLFWSSPFGCYLLGSRSRRGGAFLLTIFSSFFNCSVCSSHILLLSPDPHLQRHRNRIVLERVFRWCNRQRPNQCGSHRCVCHQYPRPLQKNCMFQLLIGLP